MGSPILHKLQVLCFVTYKGIGQIFHPFHESTCEGIAFRKGLKSCRVEVTFRRRLKTRKLVLLIALRKRLELCTCGKACTYREER